MPAIAGGLLKSSPVLAGRLAATEAELVIPKIGDRYLAIVDRLEISLGRDAAGSAESKRPISVAIPTRSSSAPSPRLHTLS
jgi:hypothetical protein